MPEECLPLTFLPLFEKHLIQTQAESTGAKPVGKFKVDDNHYFLAVVQQDDYGPKYYGMIYNLNTNKIEKCEKVAELWGDAGDSQTIYSQIIIKQHAISITKFIEFCHYDIDSEADEIEPMEDYCLDSIASIDLKIMEN